MSQIIFFLGLILFIFFKHFSNVFTECIFSSFRDSFNTLSQDS